MGFIERSVCCKVSFGGWLLSGRSIYGRLRRTEVLEKVDGSGVPTVENSMAARAPWGKDAAKDEIVREIL